MKPKKSVTEKVADSLIEGKLFRKSGSYMIKQWRKLWKRIDFATSAVARHKYMDTIDVNPKKIMFFTFQGDYTCNPKYICEELLRQKFDCEIVWAVRQSTLKKSSEYSEEITFVEQYTPDYYRELASAHVWVFNSVEMFKRKFYKKRNQFLFQTWHGSLGIKRFDSEVNAGKEWVMAARHCARFTDYCISNSAFEDDVYRGTFWSNSEILRFGHPRSDVLLREDLAKAARARVREALELEDNIKYVLYAPTFRDDHGFDNYLYDYEAICDALSHRLGGEWKMIVRFHPTVRKFAKSRGQLENCIDGTSYDDIEELMTVADVAITDYSSWIYDFVLTGKPGFLYVKDLDDYYTERGFYYSPYDTPFPVSFNEGELIDSISSFNQAEYSYKVAQFITDKGCVEDGHASERIVEILKIILEDERGRMQ